ncbi:MAG: glycosyltransferase family 4 protein [Saprospiraceae bacterium]|nr:glycosyltransferase family 4 protein [Saprospiraceae bacterium]
MQKDQRHILIVANTTWNIYNFRLNVLRLFIDKGFKVSILAPVDEYVRYQDSFREVEHIALQHLDRDSINPVKDFRLFLELLGVYRKLKPDLILHYTVKPNIYGGLAARVLNLRSIAVVTGLGYPFIHGGFARMATKILYKFSNRFHKRVIFENRDDLSLFIEHRLINATQGVSIKGCGVDTNFYLPVDQVKNNGSVTFTFIGRLLYDKGIREFVDAAHLVKSKNPKVKFWLIGQIDENNPSAIRKSDLVDWVRDPDIYYLGSKEDVRPFIAQSDCIVLPSYREAIARSLTEAMSMAKPVIGTDTAGVREAIDDHENGYLVKVKDAVSLAEAMNDFIGLSEEQRLEMGRKGRQKVQDEFDDQKIALQIWDIVNKILGDQR